MSLDEAEVFHAGHFRRETKPVGFADEVEIDGDISRAFFILHFDKPHCPYLLSLCYVMCYPGTVRSATAIRPT